MICNVLQNFQIIYYNLITILIFFITKWLEIQEWKWFATFDHEIIGQT